VSSAGVSPWRVLCLSGSLRRVSANTALLQAARQLAPAGLELSVYGGLGKLPWFNPDREIEPLPRAVAALRRVVGSSDALLIACPEYAHGVPGAFKNLLDWLVGSLEFPGKPVALLNASERGSSQAQAALREILVTMSAQWLESACAIVPLPSAGCEVQTILGNEMRCGEVRAVLRALVAELSAA
jgi:chromate reductase